MMMQGLTNVTSEVGHERSPPRRWVHLAWVAWGLVVGLSLATFAHKIPAYFQFQLDRAQRAQAGLQDLGLWISPVASAWWITLRDILVVVVSLIIGLALVRLAPSSRRMLFFSAAIVTTGISLPNVLRLTPTAPEWEPVGLLVRYFAYNLFILAVYVFPQGRIEPRAFRPFVALWPLVTVFTLLGQQLAPDQAWHLEALHQVLSLPWLLIGLWAQVLRYRNHSSALERQQTRWVITGFAGVFLGGLILNPLAVFLRFSYGPMVGEMLHNLVAISIFGFPPALFLPLAIGFSIARYRLWDLGDLLHRSLLYGLTTVLSLGLWLSLFSLLEMSASSLIGPQSNLTVISSTLAMATLVRPLHLRLQRLIDRSLYRQRADLDQALADLATELRSQVELKDIAHLLIERSRQLFFLHWAELHLDDEAGTMRRVHSLPDQEGYLASRELSDHPLLAAGSPVALTGSSASLLVPLLANTSTGERRVGVLVLGPRKSGEGYSRRARNALEGLAREAGIAMHVASLILQHREEREQLIRQLESRTAELEEFLATTSHEFVSPLFTIQSHLGILRRSRRDHDPVMKRSLQRIAQASQTLGLQLETILRIAQLKRSEPSHQNIPLDALASEAIENVLGSRNSEGAEVMGPLPSVYGDRQLLLQTWMLLIDNAEKFDPESNGALRIVVGGEVVDDWVHCFVRDHGLGIDPAYHERVFRLFEQLDPTSPGVGAGLSIARRILEIHGGRIWIESQKGEGCTVRFTLPVAK